MPRKFFHWARLLHIYTSTALFALLVFFCITGIFLNHPQQFGGKGNDGSITLDIPLALAKELNNQAALNTESLQTWLNEQFNTPPASSIDYDRELGEILFDFSLPAGYAQATVIVADAQVVFDYRKGDALSIWNDLHKGRHSGKAWSWLIDISAGLMIFFAFTGFVILFQVKKNRKAGLAFALLGLISPVALYFLFVPQLAGI